MGAALGMMRQLDMEDAVRNLTAGYVTSWNEYRRTVGSRPIYLGKLKLRRMNLQGVNFKHAVLDEVDLSFANLEGADFRDADLETANLYGASFTAARMGARQLACFLEAQQRMLRSVRTG